MDLEAVFDFVAPRVSEAARKAAAQLAFLNVRYALVGGLAVGAHGYVRATKDVDFLVGEEAFEHHGLLVTFKSGIPIEVDGIKIDYLSPQALGPQLERAFDSPTRSAGLNVIALEPVSYTHLDVYKRQVPHPEPIRPTRRGGLAIRCSQLRSSPSPWFGTGGLGAAFPATSRA